MIVNDLLKKENMSRYRLSKESGVAMTTITDICSGKADLDKCAAGTLYKIAKVLGVTVDSILENNSIDRTDYRCSFETFKSNTCHHVKDMGDIDFIVNSLTIVRKGGGQDVLYFGDQVHDALETYMQGERAHLIALEGHDKALFLSLQCKRMSVDAIEILVKKYAKLVVPNKKITPHKLRSTYGTALYRQTGDIRLVADVLGHENVNTTIDYYAAIDDEHKRKAAGAVDFTKASQNKDPDTH